MVWKILFVIYALIMLGLGFAGLGIENTVRVSPSEAIVNTCVEIVLVFAVLPVGFVLMNFQGVRG